jgi:lysophospholipase L1-like esterase
MIAYPRETIFSALVWFIRKLSIVSVISPREFFMTKRLLVLLCTIALILGLLGIISTANADLRIMPLGDSITQGSVSGVSNSDSWVSYRKALWDKLRAAGYEVNFVGSRNNGSAIPNFDSNHEGHGGWRADEIINGVPSEPQAGKLDEWLRDYQPDIVLLHIGTNDIISDNEDPAEIDDILDEIDLYSPDVWVILARIINRGCDPYLPPCPRSLQTTTFNNDVITLVAEPRIDSGDKIIVVDMENGANILYPRQPAGDMWDDVHPFWTGYEKMADVWFSALQELTPEADAGPDQTVEKGLTVTLDGSNSSDPDGDTISYQWTQIGGIPVTLSDPTAAKPTFVTPIVGPSGIILTFELTVEDSGGLKSSDEVSVTIYDNGITGFPADVLTMTCSRGKSIGIKVESGGDYVSITAVDPATIPDSSDKPENLPCGLFDLLIKTDAVGGTVKVTFYLETQAGVNDKWSKYKNSTGVWEDCSAYASFNAARDQVTVTFVDGGDGDDGPADGWIVDPSGLSSPASTSTSSGGGGGGGGGCFIDTAADG